MYSLATSVGRHAYSVPNLSPWYAKLNAIVPQVRIHKSKVAITHFQPSQFQSTFFDDRLYRQFVKYSHLHHWMFEDGSNRILWTLCLSSSDLSGFEKQVDRMVLKLFAVLRLLGLTKQLLRMVWVPLPHKKIMKQQFSPYYINSGYTIKTHPATIFVFRKEEADKVFLHELIHAIGADFGWTYSPEIEKKVLFDYQLSSHGNLAEAYTETWATVLETLFNSLMTNKPWANMLQDELDWQQYVVAHAGLDQKNIHQTTSAFSYYRFKSVLFSNLNSFVSSFPLGMKWTVQKQDIFYQRLKRWDRLTLFSPKRKPTAHRSNSLRMTYHQMS